MRFAPKVLALAMVGVAGAGSSTALADDVGNQKCVQPSGADGTGKKNEHQGGSGGSTIQKADKAADSWANRTNGAIVGKDRQAANQRAAEAQRSWDKGTGEKTEKNEKNEKNEKPGRASMQPGSTSEEVGQASAQATGGVEGAVRDITESTDKPGRYNPFAVEFNPLGLFIGGKISFTAEWAPATHHVILVNPYFAHTSSDIATSGDTTVSQTFTGVGTEIGYRYYTGHRGMNGVFVGPSLLLGVYNAGLPNGNQAFTTAGLAADVGVQEVFADHLVVGGGIGIEYLQSSHDFGDLATGPSTLASSGIKPRFLLSAGYGF
jgi:hypothetical protein